MKALFVRFDASSGPNFFGPAVVIPDLDYTTVLIGKDGSILVNYANPKILQEAKILKEFDISAVTVSGIIGHNDWGYRLREGWNNYKRGTECILKDLELQYQVNLE